MKKLVLVLAFASCNQEWSFVGMPVSAKCGTPDHEVMRCVTPEHEYVCVLDYDDHTITCSRTWTFVKP